MSQALAPNDRSQKSAPVAAGPILASPNPRRCPPHRSVSLKQSPLRQAQTVEAVPAPIPAPNVRPPLDHHKNSSGESSNAEQWFENSNNNLRNNGIPFVDDDSPFFPRGSSGDSPPDRPSLLPKEQVDCRPHHNAQMSKALSMVSGSDEYRSVIDDLTIKNKKLKKKLKQYTRSRDAPHNSEKIFEVRVHGLSSRKKRELDELLKQFTITLNESPGSSPDESLVQYSRPSALGVGSSGSSTKFGDSGYGSGATSGQTPKAGSGSSNVSLNATQRTKNMPNVSQQQQTGSAQRNQNIHSYLHDIPEGLMPKHPRAMTEKAKKKLVVRRLEQLFAGRGATAGGHQLPIQQQEISQSAAKADRSASEAQGKRVNPEGIREAPIMENETEGLLDLVKSDNGQAANSERITNPKEVDAGRNQCDDGQAIEQRPTRPLDLDPHRAQVPSENIKYIRHLGFAVSETASENVDGSRNWIYLNLLINMAQLHTINVTADFVKKALMEYSTKLELSADGRKIKWKGDSQSAYNNSNQSSRADGASNSSSDSREGDTFKSRKRVKLSQDASKTSSPNSGDLENHARLPKGSSDGKSLSYTPLFFRRDDTENDDEDSSFNSDSTTSSIPDKVTGLSSGLTKSGSESKRFPDGPIIFYNNARFYSDLSGDKRRYPHPHKQPTAYENFTASAIGSTSPPRQRERLFASLKESPLYRSKVPSETTNVEDDETPSIAGLSISSSRSTPKRVQFVEPDPDMDFEVSGIGGVQPADNFAITVVRQHKTTPSDPTTRDASGRKGAGKHALRWTDIRNAATASNIVTHSQIVSSQFCSLPPSNLPPPSYALMNESESESGIDTDSEDSLAEHKHHNSLLGVAPQPLPLISPTSQASSIDVDDDSDDEDSVDMLSTARKLDPETILAREREYDADMAERLAEEIPAGSSAATVAGGSGFESPDMNIVSDDGVGEEDDDDDDEDEPMRSVSS